MYDVLLKVILATALLDLSHAAMGRHSRHAANSRIDLRSATASVLKVDWKPIAIFPEEARRFR